jgi:peptide/nickel transport system substrate-binding protein
MPYLSNWRSSAWRTIVPALALLLVLAAACGSPAATATPGPTAPPGADPTPTAATAPAQEPTGPAGATGTLNFAWVPMEPFTAHPRFADPSRGPYMPITAYEGLGWPDTEGVLQPRLASDWAISEDGTVWTFNLRQGIQFHKGYGEMTAEDVIFSMMSASEFDSVHSRADQVRSWFRAENGSVEVLNDHTLQVNTGEPIFGLETNLGSGSNGQHVWIVSKAQVDQVGEEAASRDAAGTGPWQITRHRTGEFWEFDAVTDHWRQAPNFEKMIFWDIPEEATRLANFQTGMLDSMNMELESMPTVEGVAGTRFLRLPQAGTLNLMLYGQYYVGIGTDEQRPAYDPDLPWISADPDPNSEAWARARMVREALSLAIDREGIVNAFLLGEGTPGRAPYPFLGREERLGEVGYDYDPDRAVELLAEAGYPNGFNIRLVAPNRGMVAETPVCEAIGSMWDAIGLNVSMERIPYATWRPGAVNRTYQGGFCMSLPNYTSPSDAYLGGYRMQSIWTAGFEHPEITAKAEQALNTIADVEARARLEDEIDRFIYDNFIHTVVYSPNSVFPLSSKIDEWPLSLLPERRYPNNFELVPHRR